MSDIKNKAQRAAANYAAHRNFTLSDIRPSCPRCVRRFERSSYGWAEVSLLRLSKPMLKVFIARSLRVLFM